MIAERFRRRAPHVDYIRFLTWEAASAKTDYIPAHAIRQQRVSEFGETIRRMRADGQLPADLDPALLQLQSCHCRPTRSPSRRSRSS